MQREFSLRPVLINHQGLPSKKWWVKIFTYEPAEDAIVATRGKMYAVLSVGAKVELDFSPIMQLIMEDLHKEYFETSEGSILQALERALDGIHKKLILMAQQDKRLSSGFSFNLLTAVSWGTHLYFGQLGASRVALWRRGKLYDIDEGEQKSTGLYLSSGAIEAEDRIVLATQELFGGIDRAALTEMLELPEEALGEAIESKLIEDEEGRLRQSGMVLLVDIKEVPTVKDEGLQILDSDTVKTPARIKARAKKGGGLGDGIKKVQGWPGVLWRMRIAGVVPVLPLIIGGLAALMLAYSLLYGDRSENLTTSQIEVENLVVDLRGRMDEAEDMVVVNPDRALEELEELDGDLVRALAEYKDNDELLALQDRGADLERRVWQAEDLSPVRLATVEVKTSQARMSVVGGVVYLIDDGDQRLVRVDEQGKVEYSASSNRYDGGAKLAVVEDRLLMVSAGQAFVVSPTGELSTPTVMEDEEIVDLVGFGDTGYALSRTGQVYRLSEDEGRVELGSRYFSNVPAGGGFGSLAVDGSVYLMKAAGGIEVYLNREEQQVTWERSSWLTDPEVVLTRPDWDRLLVLQDGALLMWTKEGRYVGRYDMPNEGVIEMVGVDEAAENVYILANGAIFTAKL